MTTFYDLPNVDSRIVGWLVKYANRNYWKVQDFMSLQDLIHEGFDVLYDAIRRYPERKENDPKRFFNTVKLMFTNHIPYLQNRNIRMPEGQLGRIADMCDPAKAEAFTAKLAGADEYEAVRRLVCEAPDLIKPILQAYVEDEGRVIDMLAAPLRRFEDGTRETTNEKMCHILGLDSNQYDIPSTIRAYLSA